MPKTSKFIGYGLKCHLYNSTISALWKPLKPRGIVIHSTGRTGKYLRNYVQPGKSDPNYWNIIDQLGTNKRKDDWNHTTREYSFHFWVGANAKGKVITAATEPLNIKTWDDDYIHICLCEDDLKDGEYAKQVFVELSKLCWIICDEYNWNSEYIMDHSEISRMPDANYWLERYGYGVDKIENFWYNNINNPKEF